jgi:CBS domain containing-hemolysin-like protein
MTPRLDTFAVPDDLTNEELIPLLRERRLRRVPVYGETPDEIEGILDVQAFLLSPSAHYTELLAPPSYVSETMKALDLLRSFLTHPQGMAVVVDEHGGFEGIITLADLVEEIISDAVPDAERALYLDVREDGTLLASGNARLEDIAEQTGIKLEEEGMIRSAGWCSIASGRCRVRVRSWKSKDSEITVQRTSRKRIEELLIEPPEKSAKDTEAVPVKTAEEEK